MFRNKKKLPSKVKYQSSHFKTKLARARTYQRNPGGWSKFLRLIRSLRWSFRIWMCVLGLVVVFVFGLYLTFYPNWFFVKNIKVVGARIGLEQELHGQVDRYLDQRRFLIPHRNLLFLSRADVQSYILAVNPGVWRVDEVTKEFPHTLLVRVAPRDPAFSVVTHEGTWLISNDGLTLPSTMQAVNTLLVSAQGLKSPELGKSYFTGNLLATLAAIKKDFAALTGLPAPSAVVLKPVVFDTHMLNTPNVVPPATVAVSGTGQAELSTPVVSDLMPEEVSVLVPAGGQVSAFTVLLQTGNNFDDVFHQIQVLISKQSSDRLQHLSYIDMRFAGKAFICLQNTPCAKPLESVAPQAPTPPVSGQE